MCIMYGIILECIIIGKPSTGEIKILTKLFHQNTPLMYDPFRTDLFTALETKIKIFPSYVFYWTPCYGQLWLLTK